MRNLIIGILVVLMLFAATSIFIATVILGGQSDKGAQITIPTTIEEPAVTKPTQTEQRPITQNLSPQNNKTTTVVEPSQNQTSQNQSKQRQIPIILNEEVMPEGLVLETNKSRPHINIVELVSRIHSLTNEERIRHGAPALSYDNSLAVIAYGQIGRAHV